MTAPVHALLIRHGRAEPQGSGGDAARRLTPEGRDRFAALARRLAPRLPVRRVVSSPYARARETADLLAAALDAEVEEDSRLGSGESDGARLLALARRLGPGVALVGHNPELAQALALAGGREVDVPPGTVGAIDTEGRLLWVETG